MKHRITQENTAAEELLPPGKPDASRIGVNYTDTYIKPMNVNLEDGIAIKCKRKGLKIMLQIGDAKGEAIMNRLQDGPDPKNILRKALEAAAIDAEARFVVEEGIVYLETGQHT